MSIRDARAPLYKALNIAYRRMQSEEDWKIVWSVMEEVAKRVERLYELTARLSLPRPEWLSPKTRAVLERVEEGDAPSSLRILSSISEEMVPAGLVGEYAHNTSTASRLVASLFSLLAAAYIAIAGIQVESLPIVATILVMAVFSLASLLTSLNYYSLYMLAVTIGASLSIVTAYRGAVTPDAALMAGASAVLGASAVAYSSYARRRFYRALRRLEASLAGVHR
ncbi:MAG: hypothetical protein F7B20_06605 [Aeropyrum sp.]|nr:hypothetical protein [Aeropyrum sp.]